MAQSSETQLAHNIGQSQGRADYIKACAHGRREMGGASKIMPEVEQLVLISNDNGPSMWEHQQDEGKAWQHG